MDIKKTVIEIVADVCKISANQVKEDSSIGDFEKWDSMGHLNIMTQIQDKFDIEIDAEEMIDIEDVSDIIRTVEEKLS